MAVSDERKPIMNLRELATEFSTETNTLREFAPEEVEGFDDLDDLPPENLAVLRAAWTEAPDAQ